MMTSEYYEEIGLTGYNSESIYSATINTLAGAACRSEPRSETGNTNQNRDTKRTRKSHANARLRIALNFESIGGNRIVGADTYHAYHGYCDGQICSALRKGKGNMVIFVHHKKHVNAVLIHKQQGYAVYINAHHRANTKSILDTHGVCIQGLQEIDLDVSYDKSSQAPTDMITTFATMIVCEYMNRQVSMIAEKTTTVNNPAIIRERLIENMYRAMYTRGITPVLNATRTMRYTNKLALRRIFSAHLVRGDDDESTYYICRKTEKNQHQCAPVQAVATMSGPRRDTTKSYTKQKNEKRKWKLRINELMKTDISKKRSRSKMSPYTWWLEREAPQIVECDDRAEEEDDGYAGVAMGTELSAGETERWEAITKLSDPDKRGFLIMGFNMAGQGLSRQGGGFPKLEQMISLLVNKKVDLITACETKITKRILPQLKCFLQENSINFRISYVDDRPSRGTLILWHQKHSALIAGDTVYDENGKRIVCTTFGGPGKAVLTVCSSYLEPQSVKGKYDNTDESNEHDIQGAFYKRLSEIARCKSRNQNHLYVDMGDKNAVLNPVYQRKPNRYEPNGALKAYLADEINPLTEVLTERYPTTEIFTRVQNETKAKLDHIIINEAARKRVINAGWTECNPFIKNDHGVVWLNLRIEKKNGDGKIASRTPTPRIKGACETTHEAYNGFPVRIVHQKAGKNEERIRDHDIMRLLKRCGYVDSDFTNHHKPRADAIKAIQSATNNNDNAELRWGTMGSAIKWHNKSKEYWVHFATEMGAAHFICLINSTLSMESRQAMQIPDIYSDSHTDEHGKTCSKGRLDFASETTQKDAERFLHNTLRIPTKDIWKIEKEAPNDDATTVSRWTFRVKSPDTIRLLGSFRSPIQPKLMSKHGRETDFHVGYATGWKAYEDSSCSQS